MLQEARFVESSRMAHVKSLIKNGWPISAAGLVRFVASLSATAWSAHLSADDVAMLAISLTAMGAISSVSLGISILTQVKLGPYKAGKNPPDELFSALLLSALGVGLAACALCHLIAPLLASMSSWHGTSLEPKLVQAIEILSWTLPPVAMSAVVSIALIVQGRSGWVLTTAIASTLVSVASMPIAIYASAEPSIATVAMVNVLTSAISTGVMLFPLLGKFTMPQAIAFKGLFVGSSSYMLWPSLEQIGVMGLIAVWQRLASSVSIETLAAAGIAMSYFGICRPLVRGVSQLTSLEMTSRKEDPGAWRDLLTTGVLAAMIITSPILFAGLLMPEWLILVIGTPSASELCSVALRIFAVSFALDIVSSVLSGSLAVLGKSKSVFVGDTLSLLLVGVLGSWLLSVFGFATPIAILASYAVYQAVGFLYILLLTKRQTQREPSANASLVPLKSVQG